jgi:hypothetical protein
MNYYFLVSSLPLLQLGLKPSITPQAFLTACETNLTPEETAVMHDLLASDGSHSEHPFAQAWRDRETELRNETARLRARNRSLGSESWLRPQQGARVFIKTAVAEAFQAADPLERERSLDRLRWTILDELAGLNPFGIEAVFSYGLRLRLVCRWDAFDRKSGLALLEHAAAAAVKTGGIHADSFTPQQAVSA